MMHKVPFGNPAGTGALSKPKSNGAGAALPFQPFATVVQRKRSWAWFALHNRSISAKETPPLIGSYKQPSLFGETLPLPLLLTRDRDPLPAHPLEPTILQRAWFMAINYPLSTWALIWSIILSGWFLYLGFKQ